MLRFAMATGTAASTHDVVVNAFERPLSEKAGQASPYLDRTLFVAEVSAPWPKSRFTVDVWPP